MKNPCHKCSCSGIYIGYGGYSRLDPDNNVAVEILCKYCNGTGWIDDDDIISVPRKYVKDEYFEDGNQ